MPCKEKDNKTLLLSKIHEITKREEVSQNGLSFLPKNVMV